MSRCVCDGWRPPGLARAGGGHTEPHLRSVSDAPQMRSTTPPIRRSIRLPGRGLPQTVPPASCLSGGRKPSASLPCRPDTVRQAAERAALIRAASPGGAWAAPPAAVTAALRSRHIPACGAGPRDTDEASHLPGQRSVQSMEYHRILIEPIELQGVTWMTISTCSGVPRDRQRFHGRHRCTGSFRAGRRSRAARDRADARVRQEPGRGLNQAQASLACKRLGFTPQTVGAWVKGVRRGRDEG